MGELGTIFENFSVPLPIKPTTLYDTASMFNDLRSGLESLGVTINHAPQRSVPSTPHARRPRALTKWTHHESSVIEQLRNHFVGLVASAMGAKGEHSRAQFILAPPNLQVQASWTQTIEGWAKAMEERARESGLVMSTA